MKKGLAVSAVTATGENPEAPGARFCGHPEALENCWRFASCLFLSIGD